MRTETEMATRLLERDVHEKQDNIIALRNQLDDVKGYNIEVNSKLQVNSPSLQWDCEALLSPWQPNGRGINFYFHL